MKKYFIGLIPFFVLLILFVPTSATLHTHDNVSYSIWLETDRTSVELTDEKFIATDMDWRADWTLDDYSEVEKVYIDLFTEEMSYDYYIHNGERHQVDIDIVGAIFYRPNDNEEFDRLRYYGTTGTINAGDSRGGTLPAGDPINPDSLTGWQIGAQIMVVWYVLEHPTSDPNDYEYIISATIIEVAADDYNPITPPDDTNGDDGTSDSGTEETSEENLNIWQRIFKFLADFFDFIARKIQELLNINNAENP